MTVLEAMGMAAFAGVGEVARDLRDFNAQDLLPTVGAGLRFLVSKENRVNISIDYARGRKGIQSIPTSGKHFKRREL